MDLLQKSKLVALCAICVTLSVGCTETTKTAANQNSGLNKQASQNTSKPKNKTVKNTSFKPAVLVSNSSGNPTPSNKQEDNSFGGETVVQPPSFGPVTKFDTTPPQASDKSQSNAFQFPLTPQTSSGQQANETKAASVPPAIPTGFSKTKQDSDPPISTSRPAAPTSSTSRAPLRDYEDVPFCLVEFKDQILLPAREIGVIESLKVEEGQYIKAGSIVGKIDDVIYTQMLEQAQLRYDIAKEKAGGYNGDSGSRKEVRRCIGRSQKDSQA